VQVKAKKIGVEFNRCNKAQGGSALRKGNEFSWIAMQLVR
jgi:hypothetical protein